MNLPTLPKKEPRPIAVTVRLSKIAVDQLKSLSKTHNMSQADVIEFLILSAFDSSKSQKKSKKKTREIKFLSPEEIAISKLSTEEILDLLKKSSQNDE